MEDEATENHYIIHATLELFCNIFVSKKAQQKLQKNQLPNLVKLIALHFKKYFDKFLTKTEQERPFTNEFNDPLKILFTLYNLFAIFSHQKETLPII